MNFQTTRKISLASNITRPPVFSTGHPKVNRLSRLSSVFEPLEARTMMSAVALAVPTAVTASAPAATSIKISWADLDTKATGYNVMRSTNGGAFLKVSTIATRTTTSYVDTSVASNTSYSYRVQAYKTGSTSESSAPITVKTLLKAPTALAATANSGNSVTLTWTDNDTSAAGYYVLRSVDGVHYVTIKTLDSATAATATDTTVTAGNAYKYEVQAYKLTNTSAVSTIAAAVTPLAAPSGLSVASASSASVALAWTNNAPAATGYLVLRSTDGVHFTQLTKLTSGSANSLTDTSALPFTHYYYEIEATTAAATSPASNIGSATTPLAIPTGIVATATGPNSIKLTWNDADAAEQGYYVYRLSDGGNLVQIGGAVLGKIGTYTDTAVTSNKSYTYEVQAANGHTVSAMSAPASTNTPLTAPTALTAVVSGTSVQLSWTDNDNAATGYILARSTDGMHYTTLATLPNSSATGYTDSATVSGHSYSYEVTATTSSNTSAPSNIANGVTALAAPSNLAANAASGTSVVLTWTDNDSSATGYNLLRSVDGSTYILVAKVSSAAATTLTDTTVASGHAYFYKVQAFNTAATSAMTSAATVTTPLLAPTALTAVATGQWVNLTWIDKDASATGYQILRCTDGVNFATLTSLTSATASSYADMSVSAGQKYYYQVKATNSSLSSPASNTANATVTASTTATVTIATRYTNELVITATGADDTVSVSQNNSTLTIVANGQTSIANVPTSGLFIYTRGGADGINIDSSVIVRTTIVSVDAASDDIESAGANVIAWTDANDVYTGTGTDHAIASFAGGVAKTAGAALANPRDAGATVHLNASLFGAGPVAGDINQGGVGDCYFCSSLAAFAGEKPSVLLNSAVDNGDGTYTVEFYSGNTPTFVRVSNQISTGGYSGYAYTRPGSTGDVWAMIMEKAYAYFRTGANTYSSLNSGWMGSVYSALGQNNNFFFLSNYSENALYTMLSNDLANNDSVTLGTTNAPVLVSGHAYTLISASIDSNSVTSYVVRNPWGESGDSLENSQGYATLTFAQMEANFYDGCQAA